MTSRSRRLFGTDGIRGVANAYPMTCETAMALGRALTQVIRRSGGRKRPRIVIGKDTRLSGYMFETAITSGICSVGGEAMLVGPLPTPGISFVTSSMRADAGVMISASHNPYRDNGIKLFGADGYKLPDETEAQIERAMSESGRLALGSGIGRSVRIDDALGRYVVELKHTFPRHLTLDGIRMVVDCAHGAAYKAAPLVFRELGAEVKAIGVSPNGCNINLRCGSLHPDVAAREVVKTGAHVGVCLDGDADRVILIDERGATVDGDAVMALCATRMMREGTLRGNTLVATVMSNLGLDRAIRAAGGRVVRTAVGDRYVVDEMRSGGYNLGGEQSGHVIFLDHAPTGDGILAALQVLAGVVREACPVSEIAGGIMTRVPQSLLSFPVRRKVPVEQLRSVQRVVSEVERELGEEGRVLVRYSGTEAKARVLVEGPDERAVGRLAERIRDALVEALST
jgi:phosphoglucosamine mutase